MTEYDPDAIRAAVNLLRGIYEDRVIADAENYLSAMPDATPVPMPNTAHPAYASNAEAVRQIGSDGRGHVAVPRLFRDAFTDMDMTPTDVEPMRSVLLSRHTAYGLAPYVGDRPAVYVWPIWQDDAGRHVAGDAELTWR